MGLQKRLRKAALNNHARKTNRYFSGSLIGPGMQRQADRERKQRKTRLERIAKFFSKRG
jgi:membrane protein DedA with SNARE-associated domain